DEYGGAYLIAIACEFLPDVFLPGVESPVVGVLDKRFKIPDEIVVLPVKRRSPFTPLKCQDVAPWIRMVGFITGHDVKRKANFTRRVQGSSLSLEKHMFRHLRIAQTQCHCITGCIK